MEYGKRSGQHAGLPDGPARGPKSQRSEAAPVELDPVVGDKLAAMVYAGQVREGEIDDRALAQLAEFPPTTGVEILEQFCASDLSNVRKKSAYLSGVMNRYRAVPQGNVSSQLLPEVREQLDKILRRGGLGVTDLDARCLEKLSSLPLSTAQLALERFGAKNLSEVRNMPAYFMSTVRQAEKEDTTPTGTAAAPPTLMRPGHEAPRLAQHNQHNHHHNNNLHSMVMVPHSVVGDFGGGGGALPLPLPPPLPLGGPGALYGVPAPPGSGREAMPPDDGVRGPHNPTPPPPHMHPQPPGAAYGVGGPHAPLMLPPPLPMMSAAATSLADPLLHKVHHGVEQMQFGVRIDELHGLSIFAPYVQPATALKLQQLWDGGNRMVSLLDDRAWEALSELGAPEALAVIEDVRDKMEGPNPLRNINAYLMSVAKSFVERARSMRVGAAGPMVASYPPEAYPQERDGGRGWEREREVDWEVGRDRYRAEAERRLRLDRGAHQVGGAPSQVSFLHAMPDEMRHKAEVLLGAHGPFLKEEHFDEGVVTHLKKLSMADAMTVLHELGQNDLAVVRNIPAYLMGIIKRYLGDRR